MKTYRSVCPYDCPDCCGLLVGVEQDTVIRVAGNPEHAFTRGTLCPKMVHYEKTIHSAERLRHPLKRVGLKGEGKFTQISWEEAIRTIANRWTRLIDQYGAESIMPYSFAGTMGIVQSTAGRPLFFKLGATTQEHTICSSAKRYGLSAVMGNSMETRPQEMQDSDLIILWSINSVVTNIHSYPDIQAAQKRGAQVWVIDTHVTPTAKWGDDVVIVKPGSDGALALGMLHVIERDGLMNEGFIRDHVSGYDELTDTILAQWTPENAASVTGVSADKIVSMAHLYANARAPFIRLGSGLSRYGNGAMTTRLISALPAVVGAWAVKGGGLLGGTNGGQFLPRDIALRSDFMKPDVRSVNMNQIGEALTELKENPIRSLFVASSNPAITAPDQNKVIAGLKRKDLFTVVHERFMTDTAKYADIVLPATTSVEHDDIYYSYGHYTLQMGYQLISPIGESKSNWDVMRLLAEAMGEKDPVFSKSARQIALQMVEEATALTSEAKEQLIYGRPYEVELPRDYKLNFKTESGRIELVSAGDEIPVPDYFEPYGGTEEFWFINPPDIRILDSSFNEQFDFAKEDKPSGMVLYMNPTDAARKNLDDNTEVIVSNNRGEIKTLLRVSEGVSVGTVVSPGVWWLRNSSDEAASVNVLTTGRPADRAHGSVFYDVKVNVRSAAVSHHGVHNGSVAVAAVANIIDIADEEDNIINGVSGV